MLLLPLGGDISSKNEPPQRACALGMYTMRIKPAYVTVYSNTVKIYMHRSALNWNTVALPDPVAHVHAPVPQIFDADLEEDDLEVERRRLERRAVEHVHDATLGDAQCRLGMEFGE